MARKKNTKRADGRIAVQVYLGRDENNKRKYKTVYGSTQTEADEKALQVKLTMRKGIDLSAERDTFRQWSARWMKVKALEISEGQRVSYQCALKHINGYVGDDQITKIKTADLQSVILDLADENPNTGRPAAKQSLKVIKMTMSQVFRIAIENRVLDYNPADPLKIPTNAPSQSKRALTEAEQRWIIQTPHRAQRAAMIMMYAGLRRGEAVALQWGDIDLTERTIAVDKAAEAVEGKFHIKKRTKTMAGMRVVHIPEILTNYLRDETRDGIFVCTSASGEMHTLSSWRRMWDSYLLDLNIKYGNFNEFAQRPQSKYDPAGVPFVIPRVTPHWLRHTFATMLYLAGYDIKDAMEQLGHADAKTTIEIYTHLDAVHKRKSMEKLDKYIVNASQMQVRKT